MSALGLSLALVLFLQAEEPEESPAALGRQCEAEDMEACTRLAFKLEKGEGVRADPSAAARLYRKGCDRLHTMSCYSLGSLRFRAPEAAQAVREYEAACAARQGADCLRVGEVYGLESDKGLDAFLKACELGAARGCFAAGNRYEEGRRMAKDLPRAAGLYQKACEGGEPDSCVNLALLYQGGGLADDYPRAAAILEKGCKAASSLSCFNLASLHKSGTGVAKDPVRAAALLAESCRLGFKRACDPAALVPRPTPEPTRVPPVVAQYQDRCDRGEGEACLTLGVAAIRGLGGMPQDISRASELFGESCVRGYDPACQAFLDLRKALAGAPWDMRRASEYYLGRLHETGRGVAHDPKRAADWYREACNGGEQRGCQAAARLGQPR